MKITKIKVKNFRLLKDVEIDVEEDLSIVLGKNNSGKTSLLTILRKFLNFPRENFKFDDFNINFRKKLNKHITELSEDAKEYIPDGISLKIFIEYGEGDDLSNIGDKVMMDLDPGNNIVILAFEYYLSGDDFLALRNGYREQERNKGDMAKDFSSFLQDEYLTYFKFSRKSILYDTENRENNDEEFTDLDKEQININNIINFQWIGAKRNVSNKESDKALSLLSSEIYKNMETKESDSEFIQKFKDTISLTDKMLDGAYEEIFAEVIDDVREFGGMHNDDSIIKIVSSLQHKELLKDNTTVMYDDQEHQGYPLPESYNGLGYMNLINLIFEIKIKLHNFQREKDQGPSDINLLFIEEPEAHTHPQMQYVFIKNIKNFLAEHSRSYNLQTVLSTHSSHIVSNSNFEDIKYFKRENGEIISKNLQDLKNQYEETDQDYKFLKQYLTLHRSELFFADKAIFIEGDTERILLPAMMRKLDQEDFIVEFKGNAIHSLPLLSQNVSIIEVGAHSKIFEKFIDFIGIKALIITDIDSVNSQEKGTKCPVSEGDTTSNYSLKFFYSKKELKHYVNLKQEKRVLKKCSDGEWASAKDGHLLCVYQTEEKNKDNILYHARSFEDSFLHVNGLFVKECADKGALSSLSKKEMDKFINSNDAWEMAEKGIKSKPSFAVDILLNSEELSTNIENKETGHEKTIIQQFVNWNTPTYIRKGLEWLKQD